MRPALSMSVYRPRNACFLPLISISYVNQLLPSGLMLVWLGGRILVIRSSSGDNGCFCWQPTVIRSVSAVIVCLIFILGLLCRRGRV